MPLNKYNANVTDPGTAAFFGDPSPPFVPLSDVRFGAPGVVMPQALPAQNQVFPNLAFSIQNFPSPHVIYDNKRNGVAF